MGFGNLIHAAYGQIQIATHTHMVRVGAAYILIIDGYTHHHGQ
jgi:hypothetical protein